MLFGKLATGGLYLSYLPLNHAIAITVPRFTEETKINNLVLIRSSEEIELDDLVLVSAYLFPDQSSFELAIKDPAWHQYDRTDPSSYWSTGNLDVHDLNATIATYAYTADNLVRRGDDDYVAIDDGKKKHKYLGLLALIPVAAVGAGAYGYHIGHKQYTLKHGKPTGVNIAAPWTPTNVHPPDILKPGKLGEIITNCGGALGPGDIPRPPAEPPLKVPVPPQEVNVAKPPPQALPPQGSKAVQPGQPKTNDQPKTGDQPKTNDQSNTGDTSKPGRAGKSEELSKPVDPPANPVEAKPVEPVKPSVEGDPLPPGKPPVTDPKPPNIMDDHVPTGPPERPPAEPLRAPKPKRPIEPPPAKPAEPQNLPSQRRPGSKTPWEKLWEKKNGKDPKEVKENLEEIEKIVDKVEQAEQITERKKDIIEEQKEAKELIEEQRKATEEKEKQAQNARQEAERIAEEERKAAEQAKHAKEAEDRITHEAEELERQRKKDFEKFLEDRKAEDIRDAKEAKRLEDLKKTELREAKKLEDLKKMEAKKAALNSQKQADKVGESSKQAAQHADRVTKEAKTNQQHLNEMFDDFDDLFDRVDDELESIKKKFQPMDDRDKELNEKIDDLKKDHKTTGDEQTSKEKQPKVKTPEQEAPQQEQPKQEPPKQEPPKQEPPKQEPPKQEPPKQEPPKQDVPKEGSPPKEGPPESPPKDSRPKTPPPEGPPKSPPKEGPPKAPSKQPPYDFNKPVEPLRPRPPHDPKEGRPNFKDPYDPWKGSSKRPPQKPPVSPHSHTPVQELGGPPNPKEPINPPKLNDGGVPKPPNDGGKLPNTHHSPKHTPQFPHPEGKPRHWDVQMDLCLERGIDAAACNDKVTKYFEQAVDGRENHIVQNAPQHGEGYHQLDVPDGPRPQGQEGLRPTGNHMDLAADSTNSDIPTTLTEDEARQLEKELGGATDGAFDKADDVASAPTEQKVGRIGKELDGAVDGAFDDAAEQTGKKTKKLWMTFKGRAKDVKNGAVKAWQSVTEVWSEMFKPFELAWGHVLNWGKKLWGLMTGKVVGNSVIAKVGRCFGTFLKKFTQSRAWKAVARSGLFKFCKKWGPKILARTSSFTNRLLTIVGWVLLVQDIKDVAQTSACLGLAFEHKDEPEKMPTFCDGDATKAIIKWALTKAGEGAAAAAMFQENDYVEQDNVVTDESAWSIQEEKDPEAARKNWEDGQLYYPGRLLLV